MRDTKHNAEFIYNLLLLLIEEDSDEVKNIIGEVARGTRKTFDYDSWKVHTKPAAEDDE